MTTMGVGLEVSELHVTYGGVIAVDTLSLNVRPGEVLGLIGANGAGKTSAIDAITGYVRGSTGGVALDGVDLDRLTPHRRARAGLVRTFQQLELFDDLTVMENLRAAQHSSGRHGGPGLGRAIELFDLAKTEHRLTCDLPAGMRRIVAVARGLAQDPRVLLLDEPAAGLDSMESTEFGARLRTVIDESLGILLIDHDMSLVLSISDRVVVLENGRKIAEGTPLEVRNNQDVIRSYLGEG